MKIKVTPDVPAFAPRTISFTVESQKELDSLYTLFNYAPIMREVLASGGHYFNEVATELRKAGANRDVFEKFSEAMRKKFGGIF